MKPFDRAPHSPDGDEKPDAIVLLRVAEYIEPYDSTLPLVARCVRTNIVSGVTGGTDGTTPCFVVMAYRVPVGKTIAAIRVVPNRGYAYPGGETYKWQHLAPPRHAMMGIIVCNGPDGQDDFTDNRQWVQVKKIVAGADPAVGWALQDQDAFHDLGAGAEVKEIVAAFCVGNAVSLKHEQPGKLVMLSPLVTTTGGIRWACEAIDGTDNALSCDVADRCYYQFKYRWNCETDTEVNPGVEFAEDIRCGKPGPDADKVGVWIAGDKDSQGVVLFTIWVEGEACDPDGDPPCDDEGSISAPAAPTPAEIAEACTKNEQKCENPLVDVTEDADFTYYEFCNGAVKKFRKCCSTGGEGDTFCWYQYSAQWNCITGEPVLGSTTLIAHDCGANDAHVTDWIHDGTADNIATLTKWVKSYQVCDVDTDCDDDPPITTIPDYPTEGEVSAAGACGLCWKVTYCGICGVEQVNGETCGPTTGCDTDCSALGVGEAGCYPCCPTEIILPYYPTIAASSHTGVCGGTAAVRTCDAEKLLDPLGELVTDLIFPGSIVIENICD